MTRFERIAWTVGGVILFIWAVAFITWFIFAPGPGIP